MKESIDTDVHAYFLVFTIWYIFKSNFVAIYW